MITKTFAALTFALATSAAIAGNEGPARSEQLHPYIWTAYLVTLEPAAAQTPVDGMTMPHQRSDQATLQAERPQIWQAAASTLATWDLD